MSTDDQPVSLEGLKDPVTGKIDSPPLAESRVMDLLMLGRTEAVRRFSAEGLEQAETPIERLRYHSWLAGAAESEGLHDVVGHHARRMEEISLQDNLPSIAAEARAAQVRPLLSKGDIQEARQAVTDARTYFHAFRNGQGREPKDADSDVPLERVLQAQRVLHRYLLSHELYDEAAWDCYQRLRHPVADREEALASWMLGSLAHLEGDYDLALSYYRDAEAISVESRDYVGAATYVLATLDLHATSPESSGTRTAFARAALYVERLKGRPPVEPQPYPVSELAAQLRLPKPADGE